MSQSAGAARTTNWDPHKSLTVIAVCALLGIAVVVIQATQLGTLGGFVGQSAIMLSVAGAAIMLGGLVGFLFGIPRRLQNDIEVKKANSRADEEDDGNRPLYEGNTNLEQISDWLTKIIVGVTLVKLGDIVVELEKYGGRIAGATGRSSDSAFAVGLMIFFFVCGFLTGYLWSRLYLGRALTEAETRIRLQKKLDLLEQQVHSDAHAIGLVRQQLGGNSGALRPEDFVKAIADASPETIGHIYSLAENNRWRNWESNKEQMERSIPIFRALVANDPNGMYHRNLGQLAYCLKDKTNPEYEEAETLLTRAIASRGDAEKNGWAAYEANRAITRIKIADRISERFGSLEEFNKAIETDLKIALDDYWVKKWLRNDPVVKDWAGSSNVKFSIE